jgi:dTMP kinase
MFITFEGGEGSGKTTQSRLLKIKLENLGYKVTYTRNPGGSHIADHIRSIVTDADHKNLHNYAECLLIFASRAQSYYEVIKPELEKGNVVICDRFNDSSYIYQCKVRQSLSFELFRQLKEYCNENVEPDLTFICDIPTEIGLERAKKLLTPGEGRMETESLHFHKKIRNEYLDLFDEACINNFSRYKLIDGNNSMNQIHEEILGITLGLLSKEQKI